MKLKKLFALALCAATVAGLLAVTATPASAAAVSSKGLVLDKTATNNNDGTYTLTLESYLEAVPTDIVLVVDQSSSMGDQYAQEDGEWVYTKTTSKPAFTIDFLWNANTYYVQDSVDPNVFHELEPSLCELYWFICFIEYNYTDSTGAKTVRAGNEITYYTRTWEGGDAITKMEAVKTETAALVTGVKTAAQSSGLDHRIAVVGFGVGSSYQGTNFNYSNTGLYNAASFKTYNNLRASDYQTAFKSVLTQEADITASINALSATDNRASLHEYGLEIASNAYAQQTGTRNKVVVVITDGAPGWTGYEVDHDTAAATWAGTLIGQGATVYTINMDEDANVAGTDDTNTSLRKISSTNCYYAATILEDFDTAIKAVQTNLLATGLDLDKDTQLVDYLSAYFDFKGTVASDNIRLYTADCTGKSNGSYTFAERTQVTGDALADYTVTAANGVLSVKGFDFEACSGTTTANSTGKKLFVEVDIVPKTGFLGGNAVPTNLNTSGVYDNGAILAFPVPTVDVPVKTITPAVNNQTIYLGNNADLSLLLGTLDSRINGTDNAYANVTYDVKNANDDWLGTYTIYAGYTPDRGVWTRSAGMTPALADCTNYTLTCTVNGGDTNTASSDQPATVHVVKPVISNSDTTIYLSNSIDLNTQMTEAANWTCADGNTLPVYGTDEFGNNVRVAPGIDYTFASVADETAFAPKECTDVTVSASVEGNGVTLTDNSFKVHVLKPVVEAEDRTIWLSESVQSTAKVTGWNCACVGVTHSMHANSVKPDETITLPIVKPDDCTEYTATYTVGEENFTDTYWVHVLTAELSMDNPVIYLSQTAAFADYDTVTWETKCDHGKTPSYNAPAASAVVNGAATITPTTCTSCFADLKIGSTIYTKGVSFKVHVVRPVVSATDATIKLGNKAPETGSVDWEMKSGVLTAGKYICACDSEHNASAMPNIVPTLSVQHTGAEYPTACSNNGHKATALINGTLWEDYYANYTVHVQTPVVTGTDTTIYLGNETTLAATITDWNKCSDNEELTDANEADPAAAYTFTDAASAVVTAVKPETCANYTAKLTQIGGVTMSGTEYTDPFTVHVLVPALTVNTQDLWADCGASVDLDNAIKGDITHTWVDRQGDPEIPTVESGNTNVTVNTVQFSQNDPYTMGETDVDVNVNKLSCTVNGVAYAAVKADSTDSTADKQLTVNKAVSTEDHDFTIHVNTFALVVSHDGTQNAIFTLSDGTKVAVPAGNSTVINGLICGKTYSIDEDNTNWTWRYADLATATNQNAITCTVGSVKTEPTVSNVEVTMGYKDVTNNKWLSGEAYAINNVNGRMDLATNSMLSIFKKEEGDE